MPARIASFFVACSVVAILAMTSIASASAYSNLFVYGDNLGNIYKVSMHTIPQSPPY